MAVQGLKFAWKSVLKGVAGKKYGASQDGSQATEKCEKILQKFR